MRGSAVPLHVARSLVGASPYVRLGLRRLPRVGTALALVCGGIRGGAQTAEGARPSRLPEGLRGTGGCAKVGPSCERRRANVSCCFKIRIVVRISKNARLARGDRYGRGKGTADVVET